MAVDGTDTGRTVSIPQADDALRRTSSLGSHGDDASVALPWRRPGGRLRGRLREPAETLDRTPDELRDALCTATRILARHVRFGRTRFRAERSRPEQKPPGGS